LPETGYTNNLHIKNESGVEIGAEGHGYQDTKLVKV
jgi:hypothetical protein